MVEKEIFEWKMLPFAFNKLRKAYVINKNCHYHVKYGEWKFQYCFNCQ